MHAHTRVVQTFRDRLGVLAIVVRDRQHPNLFRREPNWKRAREVLDENRDETLERTAHGAMDYHRAMRSVVLADVRQIEALGCVVVELNRAELPLTADRVADVEVDLQTIKNTNAKQKHKHQTQHHKHRPEGR